MLLRCLVICCLSLFLLPDCRAQGVVVSPEIDSLIRHAANTNIDTVRAIDYVFLAFHYLTRDLHKAEEYAEKAYQMAHPAGKETVMPRIEAMALYYKGWVKWYQADFAGALSIFFTALKQYEKVGIRKGVGNCLFSIANIYTTQQDYEKADRYFAEAAKCMRDANIESGLMMVHMNYGACLEFRGKHEEARRELLAAEALYDKLNYNYERSGLYSNLGNSERGLGNLEKAVFYFQKAIEYDNRAGNEVSKIQNLINIGNIYSDKKDYPTAISYFEQALQSSLAQDMRSNIAQSYENLTFTYLSWATETPTLPEKDSLYIKAFRYNKLSETARDSIFSDEKGMQIAELNVKYETEKKEREISKLNADAKNQEIALLRQEVELRQQRLQSATAREHALELEKKNARFAYELELKEASLREESAVSREKEQMIALLNSEKRLQEVDIRRQRALKYGLVAGLALLAFFTFSLLRLYWQRTRANREILKQNQEIERQRNAIEVQNRQLEETNRFKSIFLSNMSHEIRTPLNTIIGVTTLLRDTPLTDRQREYTAVMRQASENLLALISDILDFSKIEAGKIELRHEPFAIREDVRKQIDMIRILADQKNLELKTQGITDLPEVVVGDAGRFNQVLLNLLGNAVKFTEKGFISLECKVRPDNGSQRVMLSFAVQDTGIGIDEAQLPVIFDAFTQAGDDTHLKFGGTGLGLAITKQLIELQGGGIGVTSTPGNGSRFEFQIPFEPGEKKNGENADKSIRALVPSCRILLVEDNQFNRMLATELLQKMIVQPVIVSAENGEQAVNLARSEPFDLILMDIKMPVMDGFTATEMLRKNGYDRPIIALTANATLEEEQKCMAAGMNDYAGKPIDPAALAEKLRRWIRQV